MAKKKRGKEKPKLANCSPDDVFRALKKLGGFAINNSSAKHNTVIYVKTGKKSTIPRSTPINRYLLQDFVDEYLIRELGFTEEDVYAVLWC